MPRPLALVLLVLALPAAENVVAKQQVEDPAAALELALTSDSRGAAWAGFAAYVRATPAPDVKAIYVFARRPENAAKAAQLLASAGRREVLLPPLMAARPTRGLAAATLAAEAAMTAADERKLALLAEHAEVGDGTRSGTKKGKGKGKRQQAEDPRVAMLLELLADDDRMAREYALIAAAHAALDHEDLVAAIDGLDDLEGSMAGARLLYQVRIGREPAPEAVADAFERIRAPVPEIRGVTPELADMPVRVPSEAFACQALGLLGDPTHLARLHAALVHDDIRVRVDAAIAIADIADPSSVPVLVGQLGECDWPVLVQVCRGLGRAPSVDAIEPLIAELGEHRGRFRLDLIYALASIAGNQYGRQTAEQWTAWWQEQREAGFAVDAAASAVFRAKNRVQDMSIEGNGGFYGLPIVSDRFCFVLDSSNSMKGGRIADLRDNATTALQGLAPWCAFNVVDFGGRVAWFYVGGLTNDRRGANDHIQQMPLTWGTRTWDAVEEAAWLEGIDTLVFLSDGAPVISQMPGWNDILTATNLMHRYRPLAVWAVSFQAGKGNAEKMEIWTGEHAGRSIDIE